jgi:hypothetical protein
LFWGPLFPWNPLKFGFKKIETYGIEKFQAYLKSYINNPKSYKIIFPEVYNE